MKLGQKIGKLLAGRGWSQARLAEKVAVTSASISRIVRGADTSVSLGVRLARALDVSAEWLLDDALDCWPPPADRSDITLLPDPVILEEVFRRKQAAMRAFDVLFARYIELREFHRRVLSDPPPPLSELEAEVGRAPRLWSALHDTAAAYADAFKAWLAYELRWREIRAFPSPRDKDHAEMLEVFDLFALQKGREMATQTVERLLVIWGMPQQAEFLVREAAAGRLGKRPARRRPAEEREAKQEAPGKPSDNLRSPGITSPGDSTHPTNADRLGKRPAGRKHRKAESP